MLTYQAICDRTHWLMGAGGTVGFDVFYEPASELELGAKARDLATIKYRLQQIHGLATRIVIQDQLATVAHDPQSD